MFSLAIRIIVTALVLTILGLPRIALADRLESEFSIALNEKDRVLGSLEGNFLVYGRPYIAMYDNQGKKLFSRKLKNNVRPTLSPNGRFLGLVTYADRSPTDLKTVKLEVFDSNGKRRWKISKPAANMFYIADNGAVFGIEGVQGISPTRLHLYKSTGDHFNVLTFDNYHGISISPSGERFIIDQGDAGLLVHDSTGNPLTTLPPADHFIFDRREQYVGAFSGGLFRLYHNEDEIKQVSFSEQEITDMAVHVEADLLILMASKKFEVYRLTSGKLLREFRLNEMEKRFTSLAISRDGRYFVCGVDVNSGKSVPKDRRHVEGYLYIFSSDGKKLIRHQETYKSWRVGFPRAAFSSIDDSVMLETAEKAARLIIR